ncbi:MAG: mannose-1-phosphate guanyltransferase [Planctomycetales bacterium]|nr:mannose-1-phosphate guanyltransferase [Planctomycetales bacterium]
MPRLYALVLAGGAGTRFWPASRRSRPKQILRIFGAETLLAAAIGRLHGLVAPSDTFVATGVEIRDSVAAECPGIPPGNILVEPVARDTAGAVALGAAAVLARDPEGTLLVTPADHLISPASEFLRTVRAAQGAAEKHALLATIGVPPIRPETGYGYLRRGDALGASDGIRIHRAAAFVEKPDPARAEEMVRDGCLWNAGIFVLPLGALREAFARLLPAHAAALESLAAARASGGGFTMVLDQVFKGLPKISLDYGVMEKAGNVAVAEASFSWDDVGSWLALGRVLPRDAAGNVPRGPVVLHESSGSTAVSDGPLVALFGVRDHLVVAAGDAVLVCPLDRAADLKALIARLEAEGRSRDL